MAVDEDSEQMGFGRMMAYWGVGLLGVGYYVATSPVRLLGLGKLWGEAVADANRVWLSDSAHRHRVQFETIETTLSGARTRALEAEVAAYVAAQNWATLCVRIEQLAETRAVCPANQRLVHVALRAAIEALEGPDPRFNDCGPMDEPRIGPRVVPAVIEASLGNVGGCVLAARVLLSQCWDLRGEDVIDAVPEDNWIRIEELMDQAMLLLTSVEDSSLGIVPLTQLRFLPFLGDLDGDLLDLYEAAVKADPGDTMPADFIGNFLLPRWGVSYQRLETLARQTAAWTSKEMGMAAYTAVYASALAVEEGPLFGLDHDMLCEGIADLAKHRGYAPDHLPRLTQLLYDLSQVRPHSAMGEAEREEWQVKMNKLYLLSLSLLEDHLSAVHPDSWPEGLEGALNMISLAMEQELDGGMDLVVGPEGISAYMPQAQAA